MTQLISLDKIIEQKKKELHNELLDGWYNTQDSQVYIKYQKQELYRLVLEVNHCSHPNTRLYKQLKAEVIAEFLQDYEDKPIWST